ncbi:MAG TPA: hypothetical protein VFW73_12715 [Lacipirellulaceae bacterium]|nr:hypothetical protein [Lacipirellulaceae bacterium]
MAGDEIGSRPKRKGFPWLGAAVAVAALTLLLQVFPLLGRGFVHALDVRHWSRTIWIYLNVGIMVSLIGVRFRKELLKAVQVGRRKPRSAPYNEDQDVGRSDFEARTQRDAEWRERARKRLPFT